MDGSAVPDREAGSVGVMAVETYVAMLHDGPVSSVGGEAVICPLRPDGTPKPVIDHHGVLYQLLPHEAITDVFAYQRVLDPGRRIR